MQIRDKEKYIFPQLKLNLIFRSVRQIESLNDGKKLKAVEAF